MSGERGDRLRWCLVAAAIAATGVLMVLVS